MARAVSRSIIGLRRVVLRAQRRSFGLKDAAVTLFSWSAKPASSVSSNSLRFGSEESELGSLKVDATL